MVHPSLRIAVALAAAAVANACLFTPQKDPFRYYTLVAEVPPSSSRRGTPPRVGLGPVSLPGYLARSSLATRVDPNQLRYTDLDRWAEPLSTQFVRVLGEDLGRALGTTQVVAFPWYPGVPLDVAVQVDVLAFETDAAGMARLDAAWTLRDPRSAAVRHEGYSGVAVPVDGPGADAAVGALSRAVAQLAGEIAAAIPRR